MAWVTPSCLRLAGTEIPGSGVEDLDYTGLDCHHQNDSYMKMGSDERHVNVSLMIRGKVTRQCPQTTTFEESARTAEAESNRGPGAYQPNVLSLGHAGSHDYSYGKVSKRGALR